MENMKIDEYKKNRKKWMKPIRVLRKIHLKTKLNCTVPIFQKNVEDKQKF